MSIIRSGPPPRETPPQAGAPPSAGETGETVVGFALEGGRAAGMYLSPTAQGFGRTIVRAHGV